jgi:hypothetical protein
MNLERSLGLAKPDGRPWSPQAIRLSFYLGVPAGLAVLYTLMRAGPAAVLPMHLALGIQLLLIFPGWWTAHLVARCAWVALRPWTPPLWFLCLVGAVGQALLLSPLYRWAFGWIGTTAGAGRLYGNPPLPEFSMIYGLELASAVAPGAIVMTAITYAYDRLLGYPRLRYAAPAAPSAPVAPGVSPPPPLPPLEASAAAAAPQILERSRLPRDCEIWALTAEEHYVRIHSDRGTDLVRYRFADALEEMGALGTGLQVHRSWWVRPDRVQSWTDRGRSLELLLRDGTRVPVSLAFRAATLAALAALSPPPGSSS